jgi:hypothetical protein
MCAAENASYHEGVASPSTRRQRLSRGSALVGLAVAIALITPEGTSLAGPKHGKPHHAHDAKKPATKTAKSAKKPETKAIADTAAPGAARKKAKPEPPPPLDGLSYEYQYDGADVGHKERAWLGRAFVHSSLATVPGKAAPILVFLHGMNTELIKYRWMGGGQEGDVRRIVAELMEAGSVTPMIVAAPSTIDPVTASNAVLLWPAFDLDAFLDRTAARLAGLATIDRSRVIVVGHSGAGCNIRGGLATALHAKTAPFADLVVDTCMATDFAKDLAHAPPATNVIVSWQSISWEDRLFDDFRHVFKRELKKANPPLDGVLRELDYEQPTQGGPHDAMVGLTLRRWLPKLVPPPAPPKAAPAADG